MEEEIIPVRKIAGLRKRHPQVSKNAQHERFAQLVTMFSLMDANHDRQLTLQEVTEFFMESTEGLFTQDLVEEIFALIDKNHDEIVSKEEFLRGFAEAENLIEREIEFEREILQKISEGENEEELKKKHEEINYWNDRLRKLSVNKHKEMRNFCEKVRFGQKVVSQQEKQGLVNEVFSSVASKYDLMNDLMSLGVHRIWKEEFVNDMGSFLWNSKIKFLDVAGGTGDIANRIIQKMEKYYKLKNSNEYYEMTVADINTEMLEEGQRRFPDKNIEWVEANAELLPFEDQIFDFYTIAFGIRNVPDRLEAIKEAKRVLKPGGRFMCLEFSKVNLSGLDSFYSLYSEYVIPSLGEVVTGDRESYEYLVDSIEQFPSQEEFSEVLKEAGLLSVSSRPLTYGIVAIHSGLNL